VNNVVLFFVWPFRSVHVYGFSALFGDLSLLVFLPFTDIHVPLHDDVGNEFDSGHTSPPLTRRVPRVTTREWIEAPGCESSRPTRAFAAVFELMRAVFGRITSRRPNRHRLRL